MTILSRQSYWGRVISPAELLVRDQTQYGKQEIDDGSLGDVWEGGLSGNFIGTTQATSGFRMTEEIIQSNDDGRSCHRSSGGVGGVRE
jgi:hypothetical protein